MIVAYNWSYSYKRLEDGPTSGPTWRLSHLTILFGFMLKPPEQTNAAVIEWLGMDGGGKLMAKL
jgi:hypothetical protein